MRRHCWLLLLVFGLGACRPSSSEFTAPVQLTADGAWCWFSDPRALAHAGVRSRTYVGWVDAAGNIVVGAYDSETGKQEIHVVHDSLEVDDHASPSLLLRPDGRLMVFYSRHAGRSLFVRVSDRPEDISTWGPPLSVAPNDTLTYGAGLRDRYCYTNPYLLTGEENRLYLFWRGLDNKPNLSTSDDLGRTWTPGRIVVRQEGGYRDQRPYLKVASDGRGRLHLAFTNGHPRDEPTNGIYYARYEDGEFRKASGDRIVGLDELPMAPGQADLVYDAAETGVRAWIWDVAEGTDGRPVIVYARLPSENDHRYHYASFDGAQWTDHEIVAAGGWFPQTLPGEREREPHYSGGVVLDHDDPRVVYLSRAVGGVFEIERWHTDDGGLTWDTLAVTRESDRDNVRPVAVRHAAQVGGPRVIWMRNERYVHYTDYRSALWLAGSPLRP